MFYFFACNVHLQILRNDKQIKRTCWKQEKGNLRRTSVTQSCFVAAKDYLLYPRPN